MCLVEEEDIRRHRCSSAWIEGIKSIYNKELWIIWLRITLSISLRGGEDQLVWLFKDSADHSTATPGLSRRKSKGKDRGRFSCDPVLQDEPPIYQWAMLPLLLSTMSQQDCLQAGLPTPRGHLQPHVWWQWQPVDAAPLRTRRLAVFCQGKGRHWVLHDQNL